MGHPSESLTPCMFAGMQHHTHNRHKDMQPPSCRSDSHKHSTTPHDALTPGGPSVSCGCCASEEECATDMPQSHATRLDARHHVGASKHIMWQTWAPCGCFVAWPSPQHSWYRHDITQHTNPFKSRPLWGQRSRLQAAPTRLLHISLHTCVQRWGSPPATTVCAHAPQLTWQHLQVPRTGVCAVQNIHCTGCWWWWCG